MKNIDFTDFFNVFLSGATICGAFLENEAPSTIWCHPQNSCLLSLRGITGDDQIAQWDTRFDAKGKKVLDDAE